MLVASFRIRLSENIWVGEVSRAFPRATFRLLAGVQTGERAVELGEIVADDPLAASRAVAAHPDVFDHERLGVSEDRSLARYETTDTRLYAFVRDASLPPEFPVVVKNGWYELNFTGTRETFENARSWLEDADQPYELLSVVETDETTDLLTDRQREVLSAAVRSGYYEVPRECRLDDLAARLDVDTSTVSEVIRRGEARVLKWFLSASGGDTRR